MKLHFVNNVLIQSLSLYMLLRPPSSLLLLINSFLRGCAILTERATASPPFLSDPRLSSLSRDV